MKTIFFLLSAFGLALILESLPYILAPARMKGFLFEMAAMPALFLQRMGIALFLLGLMLLCFCLL